MDANAPVCEVCGAPATSHISNMSGGQLLIRHYCAGCAEAHAETMRAARQQRGRGGVLMLVGAFVLLNSMFADHLHFGLSEGFGWRQMTGLGLAGLLFLIGVFVRVPTLIVGGPGDGRAGVARGLSAVRIHTRFRLRPDGWHAGGRGHVWDRGRGDPAPPAEDRGAGGLIRRNITPKVNVHPAPITTHQGQAK